MALALTSTPIKTIEGILSNVNAGRSQLPFTFTSTDFAEENYKIHVEVLDDLDQPIVALVFRYSPDATGNLFVDIKQILIEWHEANAILSKLFKIRYWESWVGFTGATALSGLVQSIYSERQIQREGGSNMWDDLPDVGIPKKFSTKFENPLIWEGFKRTVSVLVDEGSLVRNGAFDLVPVELDVNKAILFTDPVINIPTTADMGDYILKEGTKTGSTVFYVRASFSPVVYRPIDFEYREVCKNPIYLEWLNSLGGYDQHLFSIEQDVTRDVSEGIIAERSITQDLETVTQTKIRISDIWTQTVTVKAEGVTLDQFKALMEIKQSADLRVALDVNVDKYINVVIRNEYFTTYQNDNATFDISFTLEMPSNFDVYEAIDYSPPITKAFQAVAFSEGFN